VKGVIKFLSGKWLGHPLHPILAHIPMAMWPGALILDLLSRQGIEAELMVSLSFYAIAFGLAASLLAAPAGLVDWSGIKREKPAWRIGVYHMVLNGTAIVLFATNLLLRWQTFHHANLVENIPLILSAAGTVILIVSAYLGGMMSYHHGISVARLSKDKWRRIAEEGGANLPPE
jgi:uncharacterized membrane protein